MNPSNKWAEWLKKGHSRYYFLNWSHYLVCRTHSVKYYGVPVKDIGIVEGREVFKIDEHIPALVERLVKEQQRDPIEVRVAIEGRFDLLLAWETLFIFSTGQFIKKCSALPEDEVTREVFFLGLKNFFREKDQHEHGN